MEENLRQQFENTFSTCRRSPRIFEKTVKETPTTVRKQILSERNNLNSKTELNLIWMGSLVLVHQLLELITDLQ